MKEKTTNELQSILNKMKPGDIQKYLDDYKDSLYCGEKDFAVFMKEQFKTKKLTQQEVFLKSFIPERYGYKLLSGEKRTVQRDIILRMCFASKMALKDIQTALTLYGMPILYSKIPRDAVLIIAANQQISDVSKVDALLEEYGFAKLTTCGADED